MKRAAGSAHARFLLGLVLALATGTIANAAVSCGVSTSGVAFGTYESILNQTRDTSGTISVTCSGTIGDAVSYSLSLNPGGASFLARTLAGAENSL